MKLAFGKFKGQQFSAPKSEKPLHHQLNGWDGHSRKGQAVYNAIFEQEKQQALSEDCRMGICSCCEGSMYFGI